MKAAILQCDHVLDLFLPTFSDYDTMVKNMFHAVDADIDFDVFDCQQMEYPPHPEIYDFFVTTGSRSGVYEDEAWIRRFIDFIRELDQKRIKLVGICFGHQAIAEACGGKVENSAKGWGIGLSQNRIIQSAPWLDPELQSLRLLVSHQDQVIKLPAQARVIAASEFCPFYLVQWSDHFLSVQGHPEWRREYSRTLIEFRRGLLPAETVQTGLASLAEAPHNREFTRWALNFVHS